MIKHPWPDCPKCKAKGIGQKLVKDALSDSLRKTWHCPKCGYERDR